MVHSGTAPIGTGLLLLDLCLLGDLQQNWSFMEKHFGGNANVKGWHRQSPLKRFARPGASSNR